MALNEPCPASLGGAGVSQEDCPRPG